MDGSGTINPAALNAAVLPTPASINAPSASPRGVKRSRSPDQYRDIPAPGEGGDDDDDDQKPRKRGRPPKQMKGAGGTSESPLSTSPQGPGTMAPQTQTPQLQSQSLPQHTNLQTPTQASPQKPTPTKTVVKALPTVRDHTTDQLSPEGDEYIPREYDEAGERKVSPTGYPMEGREYRCRTFRVPNRGERLFMLATECARVLGYRDSYLLFNKNRSLFKIIASQTEKDDLISQEILPYSYRSRQIAIVTAKSMFRQFGSRVIVNGRRVRDDYWESKAIKQGFTEDDPAGEKRPGATKARETAAAEAANAVSALGHHGEIVYSNGPGHLEGHGQPQTLQPGGLSSSAGASLAPLPMIHLAPADDLRLRDYGNVPRPRQEISGPPYQDRTQPSSATEILGQAAHTADFNKILGQQRSHRAKYLDDFWKQNRDPPVSPAQQHAVAQNDPASTVSQTIQSPQLASSGVLGSSQQPMISSQQRAPSQMMTPQAYSQQQHQQNILSQSPVRSAAQSVRPDQLHQRSSGLGLGSQNHSQGSPYGYPPSNQMWPPPQPQQSPLSSHGIPQYNTPVQTSPHAQQSPHHPPPQLHHQPSGSMHGGPMAYQVGQGLNSSGYPPGGRGLYGSNPNQQQQMLHQQTTGGQQPGMPGWAPSGPGAPAQPGWPGY
ncbi:MAG: hypothetical protein M1819_000192 [Sarea resinae]|nr:MAG: hypothetical protein M1819_000192 [Sarea resinae]